MNSQANIKQMIDFIENSGFKQDFNEFCEAVTVGKPLIVLLALYFELKTGFSGYMNGAELAQLVK